MFNKNALNVVTKYVSNTLKAVGQDRLSPSEYSYHCQHDIKLNCSLLITIIQKDSEHCHHSNNF